MALTEAQRRMVARKYLESEDAWPTITETHEAIQGIRAADHAHDRESWAVNGGSRMLWPFEHNRLKLRYAEKNQYWNSQVWRYQWFGKKKAQQAKQRQAQEQYQRLTRERDERFHQTALDAHYHQNERQRIAGGHHGPPTLEELPPPPMPYRYQPFPRWKYHVSGKSVIVENIEQARALGLWWFNTPERAQMARTRFYLAIVNDIVGEA